MKTPAKKAIKKVVSKSSSLRNEMQETKLAQKLVKMNKTEMAKMKKSKK